MFCPYCGKELKDEAPFCGFCGKPLKKGKGNNAPVQKENGTPSRADRKAAPTKQAASLQQSESMQEPALKEKKKRGSPLIVVLIIILLLLLAAATLAFLIYSGRVDATRVPFVGEKLELLLNKNGTGVEEKTDLTPETSAEPTKEPTPEPSAEPILENATEPTPVPQTDIPATNAPEADPPKTDLPTSNATDEITSYEITAEVNDDGTVNLEYHIDWKVLKSDEIGPLQWVTIGIPNSNYVRFEKLTDTIKDISYSDENNSSLRIQCDKAYYAGETFSFGFLLVQDDMYQKDPLRDGETTFVFTPGGFDEIAVDNLTVRWSSADVVSNTPDSRGVGDYNVWTAILEPGESFTITVNYDNDARSFKSNDKLKPPTQDEQDIMLYMLIPSETSNQAPGFCYFDSGHDNEGNWYSNSIGGFEADTTNWCEYQINSAYKTISGIVYLNYDFRNETANYAKMTIYGDGKLLYTSSVITAGLTPQLFSVNIEGVQTLRVCIYGNEYVRVSDCSLST